MHPPMVTVRGHEVPAPLPGTLAEYSVQQVRPVQLRGGEVCAGAGNLGTSLSIGTAFTRLRS